MKGFLDNFAAVLGAVTHALLLGAVAKLEAHARVQALRAAERTVPACGDQVKYKSPVTPRRPTPPIATATSHRRPAKPARAKPCGARGLANLANATTKA
jgi:hypothetical protein